MGFVELEQKGKQVFERFPLLKRSAKRVYQLSSYILTKEKVIVEGNVERITPTDEYEYFYGYYDKSPWDITDRYLIALRVKNSYKHVAPEEEGMIVVIDTMKNNQVIEIATTNAWNVQQGCMAQWLGPDYGERIIYNDFRDGSFCSVIYNFAKMKEEKVLGLPIYDVSCDGSYALTLDFTRLHRMRPGYGYSNIPESTRKSLCPNNCCIWKIDLTSGFVEELFCYSDFASFEPNESMILAEHKVNHIMISPNCKRFMVLHRWFKNGRKHTRLVTVNVDKTEMYNLSDDVFVSHCFWKNDNEILSFLRKENVGDHYYLLRDKSDEYEMYWPELNTDGHCSYSTDKRLIITDSYPNRKRIASIFLCTESFNRIRRIAKVFSPFRYDNECRCDLHPRWNHKNSLVCFDSVHDKKRGLYVVAIDAEIFKDEKERPLVSVIIPCYNASKTIENTLQSLVEQSYDNFEVIIVNDGSTDNTAEIISSIAKQKVLNISLVNQENAGVSVARNRGLECSQGKYVSFLDADDIYNKFFLERLVEACEIQQVDVALVHSTREIEQLKILNSTHPCEDIQCDIETFMEYFMYNKENIHFTGLLYRNEIIKRNDFRFPVNTKYGEDLEFVWKYLMECKNGILIKDKLYGYYDNPASAVNNVSWEKTDLVDAMIRVQNYMKNKNFVFFDKFTAYFLPRTVWTTAKTFAKGKRKDYYNRFIADYEVRKHMRCLSKSAKNRLLRISSKIFLFNKFLFYFAIGLVYKYR